MFISLLIQAFNDNDLLTIIIFTYNMGKGLVPISQMMKFKNQGSCGQFKSVVDLTSQFVPSLLIG